MIIRILIVVFILSYIIWLINNRILGRNLVLAKVIATTLVVTSVVYLILGSLSYLIEGV
ncbi:hypothetical protein BTHERMOSOX_1312 [Bathymodiolus thermophilus thioautotrophic gill symbiont]|uniref:Uncharacterized protein n=1 Tax=Bathymodiolus thermophilus thioautotrophic gill symbiont TaxID=2360 RepID=A0A3G3ILF1_9GAMM|nr:hypothetical protein [Bathymodiolus thermophilus thioautotrophic gill symbiont]AYQ56677.1 hypothetical protein MS2017_0958 [Bathymodiolus thermophilus thioautotrophic gill symbiont]CAB5498191.1 hypothetical protein THERMOT_828 [Bathymodiolus thermophilus thioautotrophic gill symbiont]CAB5503065.1 hypothetical protein THERMOS_1722 [Bathymodiolus thermophilus thioautotrophic gill symbiont]SHA23659.1 hypothetical protein BTHERMOSOX_1312 [Bathymodiolus thermophilus thioautotrophic gill symbiont]